MWYASKCDVGSSSRSHLLASPVVRVLCYLPNVVGYLRIGLLLAACVITGTHWPHVTLTLFLLNFALDALDGYLARRLSQVSEFGAFLDVSIDLASRGMLWVWAAPGNPAAFLPPLLELLTFVCTYRAGGAGWKKGGIFSDAPGWVLAVMKNEFRSVWGGFAMQGIMLAPLWLWLRRYAPSSFMASAAVGPVVGAGKCLATAVEMWVLFRHVSSLLQSDMAGLQQGQAVKGG
eukprot:jgi/Botrbrau1/17969/Bobra.50_1s0058.1